LYRAFENDTPALVIDQSGSIANSPMPLPPGGRAVPVAYRARPGHEAGGRSSSG